MSREAAAVVLLGIAAVLGFFCLSPMSPLVQKAAPEGQEGLTWSPANPVAHRARGGLYHPPVCGEGRTGLIEHGWEWISNPPSEVTSPGYQS